VRILIDTHYVLWSAFAPSRIAPWARKLLVDLDNEILVSAASAHEISLKVRKGRSPEAAKFESDLIVNIEDRLGFVLMRL
jgi:PIN domain nuclease of toxin-antitoxin system